MDSIDSRLRAHGERLVKVETRVDLIVETMRGVQSKLDKLVWIAFAGLVGVCLDLILRTVTALGGAP